MITLGIDVGTNSVGSAWIDTEKKLIDVAVSVFPAGVEESETKRGAPSGQARRDLRSQRRSIARRARRKLRLRKLLTEAKLLPCKSEGWDVLVRQIDQDPRKPTPWHLRRLGLSEPLAPYEFGRVLLHLAQRRGARGVDWGDEEDQEAGRVKQAISETHQEMVRRNANTFGELMAAVYDQRRQAVPGKSEKYFHGAIRNREGQFEFHADRELIRQEFHQLWKVQRGFKSELSKILTDDLLRKLDDPTPDRIWSVRGALFGQRRIYWDAGTLGRCSLEPTDRLCPQCDMYASEFRVLQTVNSIKIEEKGQEPRTLDDGERAAVIQALTVTKTATTATLRKALKIHTPAKKKVFDLNLERMKQPEINTDWFGREIIEGVFGRENWKTLTDRQQASVNQALQKIDDQERLRQGAATWWNLELEQIDRLVDAWKKRPPLEKRVNLSRRAIQKLLPHLRDGQDVTTAKQNCGYSVKTSSLTKSQQHYLQKHTNSLPPAPYILNPVVRKCVHEVRRHVNAWLRKYPGTKPDRIIVEFARGMTLSSRDRNDQLSANRAREFERRKIEEDFAEYIRPGNPAHKVVLRVRLWTEQKWKCAYSNDPERVISRDQVGSGEGLEIDHIIPDSRGGGNSFHNKVLCFRESNRNKGNRTPREWMSREEFAAFERRFAYLNGRTRGKQGEYDLVPNPRKYQLMCSSGRSEEEWRESQLTDTSYAAKAVTAYLQDALYRNDVPDSDGKMKRRLFATKGQYTGMLRHDWGLLEDLMPQIDVTGTLSATDPRARREKKDRADHRHHAIDAVVIAFCGPELLTELGAKAQYAADYKSRTGYYPPRQPIDPHPDWGTKEEFRQRILNAVRNAVVAHRPVKRRLIGALHEATCYGVVDIDQRRFTTRIPLAKLTPKMLRLPVSVSSPDGRTVLQDPPLEKSGLVRDQELRRILRTQLTRLGVNPETFSKKQIEEVAKNHLVRMPSGVPIRRVTLLRTITEPVIIQNSAKPTRVYQGGNNHHFEILRDENSGKWVGRCWDMFTVAQRVRPPRGLPKLPMVIGRDLHRVLAASLLDEQTATFYRGRTFIMSLSQGETLYCRHKDRQYDHPDAVGYYVVVKLDKDRITLAPHWDAKREHTWPITPEGLRGLGPTPGTFPHKVRLEPWASTQEEFTGIIRLHD